MKRAPYATHATHAVVVDLDGLCSAWDLHDCREGDWQDEITAVFFVAAGSEKEAEAKVREWIHLRGGS